MMKKLLLCIFSALLLSGCNTGNVKPEAGTSTAIKTLEAKVQSTPDDPQAHIDLSQAYFDEAKKTNSFPLLEKATISLGRYLDLVPQDLRAKLVYYDFTFRLVSAGNLNYAPSMRRVYKELPNELVESYNPPSMALFYKEIKFNPRATDDQLLPFVKKAIKENPYSARANLILANIYADKGRYAIALASLNKINKKYPESFEIVKNLGQVTLDKAYDVDCQYNSANDFKAALKHLKQASKMNPADPELREDIASIYEYFGRHNLQLNQAKQWVKYDDSIDAKTFLAYSYYSSGQAEKSLSLFEDLMGNHPNDSGVLVSYSQIHFYLQDWVALDKTLEKLHKVDGSIFYDYLLHSYAQQKLNGLPSAKKSLAQRVKLSEMSSWEKALYQHRLGGMSSQQLRSKAKDVCEQTEAEFYIGMESYLSGDVAKAKQQMNKVLDLKVHFFVEHMAAKRFASVW